MQELYHKDAHGIDSLDVYSQERKYKDSEKGEKLNKVFLAFVNQNIIYCNKQKEENICFS